MWLAACVGCLQMHDCIWCGHTCPLKHEPVGTLDPTICLDLEPILSPEPYNLEAWTRSPKTKKLYSMHGMLAAACLHAWVHGIACISLISMKGLHAGMLCMFRFMYMIACKHGVACLHVTWSMLNMQACKLSWGQLCRMSGCSGMIAWCADLSLHELATCSEPNLLKFAASSTKPCFRWVKQRCAWAIML